MKINRTNLLFLVMIFSFGIYANGQKRKAGDEKGVAPPPPPVIIKKKTVKKANAITNYTAVVEINENSKISVIFIDSYGFKDNSDSIVWVESIFSNLNRKTQSQKTNLTDIIIKPSPILSFGKISELVKKIRKSANQDIKIQLDGNTLAEISKPLPTKIVPNPLFLLVNVDEENKISLNNEPLGSIDDLTQLKNLLEKVFKERSDNGIFRVGNNEVEQTVFINAAASVKITEINRIIKALREVGANPIGLQIDDFVRSVRLEAIEK